MEAITFTQPFWKIVACGVGVSPSIDFQSLAELMPTFFKDFRALAIYAKIQTLCP